MVNPAFVVLTLMGQIAAPPSGPSPQAKAAAQVLLSDGTALYEQGDYATALEKFEEAYRVFPSPKLWFNIGTAKRDLGRPVEALQAFENFVADALDATPELRAQAQQSIAQLQGKLGRLRIECSIAGTEIGVDGKPVGQAPLPHAIWTVPGRHQVTARHSDFAAAIEDVDVIVGQVRSVTLRLAARDAIPVPLDVRARPTTVDEAAPVYKRWWFWTAIGVVVAGAAGTFAIIHHNDGGSGCIGIMPCGAVPP